MLCTTKSLNSTSSPTNTHESGQHFESPITTAPDTSPQRMQEVAFVPTSIAGSTYGSEQHAAQSPITPNTITTQHAEVASASADVADAQTLLGLCEDDYQQTRVPAFFNQIMVPEHDFVGADPALPAPDLAMWLPETDWIGEVDLFNKEFDFSIGETHESQLILDNFFATAAPAPTATPAREPRSRADQRGEEAKRRSAIFEQSPWYVLRDHHLLMHHLSWVINLEFGAP